MVARIPPDAFDVYFSLGPSRSYQAVAARFGVTKRAVTKHAVRAGWQQRLADLERKARERSDDKIVETLDSMNGRHLRMWQVVQGRALEALKAMPLKDAMAAVRALDLSVKGERVARGEPTERGALDIESVIRREYESWMRPVPGSAQHLDADGD
jgi:hypothetical protein